jgi:N-acetylglucosaminyldiphosphoundecaprenol N-acetyl-beta-D-mannosaminyltransferase
MDLNKFISKLPTSQLEIYNKIENIINKQSKSRLYSIDLTNFSTAFFDDNYLQLLKSSEIHCVDSSWLPSILDFKYDLKIKHSSLTDIFDNLIVNENYKHLILGGPQVKLERLSTNSKFLKTNMDFYELPFVSVDKFNYKKISNKINKEKYDFIWVSLGAPKQEIFINKLFPLIDRGIVCGCGYIIDIYSGTRRAPLFIRRLRLEWVFRLLQNPKKQFRRVLSIIKFLIYFAKSK